MMASTSHSRDHHDQPRVPQVALRSPETVMRLARMGTFYPTRLSFNRILIRRLGEEGAAVERALWEIDANGFGRAVYTTAYGGFTYSLVAFSLPLADEARSDRVIAEAWDTTYVLFDGIPDADALARLEASVPLQEAGRFAPSDLVLCRANKSVRLFTHVVDRLAQGLQPDADLILSTGYLMRTTAVYGNGKFGIADRMRIADRPGLGDPFQAEMLTVWMIRGFTFDLVEHIARERDSAAFRPLARRFKRFLGIGNATGLGMAPFLVSHPILINNWVMARETALARALAVDAIGAGEAQQVGRLMQRARCHLDQWNVDDARQSRRITLVRQELAELKSVVDDGLLLAAERPYQRLLALAGQRSMECQELIVALVIEANGDLVDGLGACMASDVRPRLEPGMTLGALVNLVDREFAWALALDFDAPGNRQQFWYVSEEKLEPRLGDRFAEDGAERELPLDIARQVQALRHDLAGAMSCDENGTVAGFLRRFPQHRNIARRVQTLAWHPYSEIRDNLVGADCLAIDMLRWKLSFFGAVKFDPKSDRWTRIALFQGAPLFDDLGGSDVDDWWLPALEAD